MSSASLEPVYSRFKYGQDDFHNLMAGRIRQILLIATFYDAYVIEYDGRLMEKVTGDYMRLNLTNTPRITSVSSGRTAFQHLEEGQYDLVLMTMHVGPDGPLPLSREIRRRYPRLPICFLLTSKSDILAVRSGLSPADRIDGIFLWNGLSNLVVAVIKLLEDRWNVDADTRNGLVRVILLVEDSIEFTSLYLPLLYEEVMKQTQRLIAEGLNDSEKYFRMRSRPKILLAENMEEALELFRRFKEFILTVITDNTFPVNGRSDPAAGEALIRTIRADLPDLPILLQSNESDFHGIDPELKVECIRKTDRNLLGGLREFMLSQLGFGSFIFRDSHGAVLESAESLADLESKLHTIPLESILYHARRQHFSSWLIAHGEFTLARLLRPLSERDFATVEEHREFLFRAVSNARAARFRGRIVDFDRSVLQYPQVIMRLGEGSLGGKGRGLAFANSLLSVLGAPQLREEMPVRIPRALIIGTDEYARFIASDDLFARAEGATDSEIRRMFLAAPLDPEILGNLRVFMEERRHPLAVRSSSLLEDAWNQPFAGVYSTYMLACTEESVEERLRSLAEAVKLVYASVFLDNTLEYIRNLNYRTDEEKMAVVIQELVGHARDGLFFPDLSGVAQSWNYYPLDSLTPDSHIASLAVGYGQTVVSGRRHYRYAPEYPAMKLLSIEETAKDSQSSFFAVDIVCGGVTERPLAEAEQRGALDHSASTWDGFTLTDGIDRAGSRVIDFPDVVKYEMVPLSDQLNALLNIFSEALGGPVEIEFAVDDLEAGQPELSLLQVRPMGTNFFSAETEEPFDSVRSRLLYSTQAMGHGPVEAVRTIVYLPADRFDKTKTEAMREEIRRINAVMRDRDCRYVLMAPGRWGTRDRFLGIPVDWKDIDGAAVLVETGIENFQIPFSQGNHFFHNLVTRRIGYLNIPWNRPERGFIDWKRLNAAGNRRDYVYFVIAEFPSPLPIRIDGRRGCAVIGTPETFD